MKKKFWFYYAKSESARVGKPRIAIVVVGEPKTVYVGDIRCFVPTMGRIDYYREPAFAMTGEADSIQFLDDVAIFENVEV